MRDTTQAQQASALRAQRDRQQLRAQQASWGAGVVVLGQPLHIHSNCIGKVRPAFQPHTPGRVLRVKHSECAPDGPETRGEGLTWRSAASNKLEQDLSITEERHNLEFRPTSDKTVPGLRLDVQSSQLEPKRASSFIEQRDKTFPGLRLDAQSSQVEPKRASSFIEQRDKTFPGLRFDASVSQFLVKPNRASSFIEQSVPHVDKIVPSPRFDPGLRFALDAVYENILHDAAVEVAPSMRRASSALVEAANENILHDAAVEVAPSMRRASSALDAVNENILHDAAVEVAPRMRRVSSALEGWATN